MLTSEMRRIIRDFSGGAVATVNDDGTPSVSTKATFVVVDDTTIAFGNLRSPGTVLNIRQRPAVEICFLDVLKRKAVRVTGRGRVVGYDQAEPAVRQAFETHWADYLQRMRQLVVIDVSAAELILSPAYDSGAREADLHVINLQKLNKID